MLPTEAPLQLKDPFTSQTNKSRRLSLLLGTTVPYQTYWLSHLYQNEVDPPSYSNTFFISIHSVIPFLLSQTNLRMPFIAITNNSMGYRGYYQSDRHMCSSTACRVLRPGLHYLIAPHQRNTRANYHYYLLEQLRLLYGERETLQDKTNPSRCLHKTPR
jgi:hypothetical protein